MWHGEDLQGAWANDIFTMDAWSGMSPRALHVMYDLADVADGRARPTAQRCADMLRESRALGGYIATAEFLKSRAALGLRILRERSASLCAYDGHPGA